MIEFTTKVSLTRCGVANLCDGLIGLHSKCDVLVLEGNKVIEVRNTGINQGVAALEWLGDRVPEFILGVGDDWTDEDLFRALPRTTIPVRVGPANTTAKYYLGVPDTVRKMLRELSESSREKINGRSPTT